MVGKIMSYEKVFLDKLVDEKEGYVVFARRLSIIKGFVLAHDDKVIVMDVSGRWQVVYKHGFQPLCHCIILRSCSLLWAEVYMDINDLYFSFWHFAKHIGSSK